MNARGAGIANKWTLIHPPASSQYAPENNLCCVVQLLVLDEFVSQTMLSWDETWKTYLLFAFAVPPPLQLLLARHVLFVALLVPARRALIAVGFCMLLDREERGKIWLRYKETQLARHGEWHREICSKGKTDRKEVENRKVGRSE